MFKLQETKNIIHTSLDGLLVIKHPVYKDDRGFFQEIWRQTELSKAGVKFTAVQANRSLSKPGVIRAIHSENWGKIVTPCTGIMFAAIADVRPESCTFGKVATFTIDTSDYNNLISLYLPPGIGNSICVIGKFPVIYYYTVTEEYSTEKAKGIAWDDPDLGIKWPIKNPIISERDKNNPKLRDLYPHKFK